MGNKSGLLLSVGPLLSLSHVPEMMCIPVREWLRARRECVATCNERFAGPATVAVRSDSALEDDSDGSRAGAFLSMLDVAPTDLEAAIDTVISSMPRHPDDAVIIQRMVAASSSVCVASTHRIADGAPWYCLNSSPSTGPAVTNGRTHVRQVAVPRTSVSELESIRALDDVDRLFLAVLREIELLLEDAPLEIEAAIDSDSDGRLRAHLLQIRRLSDAVCRTWVPSGVECRLPSLDFLLERDDIDAVAGTRTVLSLMADWNPAELIGAHPRPLALSLYRTLISENVWWNGRAYLGYAARPEGTIDLLRVMHGRPLVDVRRSASSMLPRGLAPPTSNRIVDTWIARLIARPALHDKVEFSVFRTVRDFAPVDGEQRDEYRLALVEWAAWNSSLDVLSRAITRAGNGSPLEALRQETESFARGTFDSRRSWVELLSATRTVATLFSSIARLAFVGESQLRSAVMRGALSAERASELRSTASVRATQPPSGEDDAGHLRPGTFEITAHSANEVSGRFAERMADAVVGPSIVGDAFSATGSSPAPTSSPFSLRPAELQLLDSLLRESGFTIDSAEWLRFASGSLRARERAKFVLSRHISALLEHMIEMSSRHGSTRGMISWLDWRYVVAGAANDRATGTAKRWSRQADVARRRHEWEASLIISPMLVDDSDRMVAISSGVLPNFIGRRIGEGPIVALTDPDKGRELDLAQAIVVTNRADPGYEWLFQRNIAGLITAWGGANSHLGIRCAEHSLPAAIGCGEAFVSRAMLATHARIDPLSGGIWLR